MKYEDFICFVQTKMQEKLGEAVQIRLQQITKNNAVVLDGLSISEEGSAIAPTLYLNEFYQQYEEGRTIPEIVDEMAEVYENNRDHGCFDASFYADFEKVKPHLMCRIINYKKNSDLLRKVPHLPYLNLAIVVCCRFEDEIVGNGSIQVSKKHLSNWKITEEELFRIARENTLHIQPQEFLSIRKLLEKYHIMMEEETYLPMYVLTNISNYFGAVCIIYDSVLEQIGEELGGDFWVLPSSIHECVVVPADLSMTGMELSRVVKEINQREVKEEEFLSDSIYYYSRNLHKLSAPLQAQG